MNRIEKLQQLLEGQTLLVEKEIDLFYLTGLKISAGSLLVKPKEAFLYVDSRYYEMCRNSSPVPVIFADNCPFSSFLEGIEILGFDSKATSYARFVELQNFIPVKPIESPVACLRMLKEEEEVRRLKEAAQLGVEGFTYLKSLLREGILEKDLAQELEIFWAKRGAISTAFEPIVAFGANSAMPHYRHGDVALKQGMNVLIDIGVNLNYYLSDMTRVLFFGPPDPRLKEIHQIVAEAQQKALSLCCEGTLIGELDKAARDHIIQAGYGDYFGHSLGHGVGLEIHELPGIRQKPPFQNLPLQAGMVITIEPGIYLPGIGGVRLEDTIVITKEGYENLTNLPLNF